MTIPACPKNPKHHLENILVDQPGKVWCDDCHHAYAWKECKEIEVDEA